MADDHETKFYIYLKRKYKLSDDDIEEYVDSFNIINRGEDISPIVLKEFINDEADDSDWTTEECKDVIVQINKQINSKTSLFLNLHTYLLYVIPICCNWAIARIGIREMFDTLDADHDNKITCKELTGLLYKINRQFSPSELESYKNQINKLCTSADTNRDGYISYDEFKNFIFSLGIIPGVEPKLPEISKHKDTSVPNYGSLSVGEKKFKRVPSKKAMDFYDEPVKTHRSKNKPKHLSMPINPRAHYDSKTESRVHRPRTNLEEKLMSDSRKDDEEESNFISLETELIVPKINDDLLMAEIK
jgi:Ca2+-binding EF-hand superfamily protein